MVISKINLIRLFSGIILFFMALIALSGCSISNYGKLRSNPEVTRTFEAYQILPDHKYYYRGTFSRPIAIVGINKNFVLNSKLWIDRVSLQGLGSTTQPWGFTILDKSGNDVGVWYSAIRAAAVQIDERGLIVNLSPIRTVTVGDQEK